MSEPILLEQLCDALDAAGVTLRVNLPGLDRLRAETDAEIARLREPLHQPARDLSRVAVRTCPISGLESHR